MKLPAPIQKVTRELVEGWLCLAAPPQCPACRGRIAERRVLCRPCRRRLLRERGARVRVRFRREGLLVSSLEWHRGVWARLVRAYKQDPAPALARYLEGRLTRRMRASLRWTHFDDQGPILVPVPMARVRKRERGWNPAQRLAASVADATGWPLKLQALERRTYRRPLRGLSARERRQEMTSAMAAGPQAEELRGRRVVLLDDVLTTGATLGAGARALRPFVALPSAAGDPNPRPMLTAWTLSRTPRRRPQLPGP